MKTSQLGIDLIKHYEGVFLTPYLCPANVVTCGIGHVIRDNNGEAYKGDGGLTEVLKSIKSITEDQAVEWLKDDLVEAESQLNKLNLNLKQYEFDALISFIFNCGFRNFEQSRLLRMVKTRIGDIEYAFSLWNKSSGKVLPGLVARRKSEWVLFSTGELKFFN